MRKIFDSEGNVVAEVLGVVETRTVTSGSPRTAAATLSRLR